MLFGVSLACSGGMNSLDLPAQLKVAGQAGLWRLPREHACRRGSSQYIEMLHDTMVWEGPAMDQMP